MFAHNVSSPTVSYSVCSSNSNSSVVRAEGLWKNLGGRDVVCDISFEIGRGDMVGFVGPNGSGKTTTIRMLLDILTPDRGNVTIFGSKIDNLARRRIGYLPEERGLYMGARVVPMLRYLAELKGVPPNEAVDLVDAVLERVELSEHRDKKVSELSRGMSQLIQFGSTIQHSPEFVVLDEPFSGLDPVNRRIMSKIVAELRETGTAVMFSTHQMTNVEELCDRVIMINQGELVLDGQLRELKHRFAGGTLILECERAPPSAEFIDTVDTVEQVGAAWRITASESATPQQVLASLVTADIGITRFEIEEPSLEEIFVQIVGDPGETDE